MIIGRYTLVRQLPGGRHGAVWKARDTELGHDVALKQLASVTASIVPRLRSETDRLAQLQQENLATSYPAVIDDTAVWLAEDWVEGTSLATVLHGANGLTRAQALGVLHGALTGLAAAHRSGVVHGDLAPRTLLISTAGQPVVVGFGTHFATDVGGLDGFASPETSAGRELTPAADVFSAGAMLRHLLAEEGVPAEIRPVLDRAQSTDPASRQPDARAFLDELEPAAERAFGAGWWTTAGLGGVVATTMGAAAAAAGGTATATGGMGAVAGTMSAGEGALTGAMSLGSAGGSGAVGGTSAVAGRAGLGAVAGRTARSGKRAGLIIAGAATVLIVVVVGALAVLRPGQSISAAPGSGAAGAPPAITPVPSSPATRTPTATPTPKPAPPPNPRLGSTGTYRWEYVITKSNDPRTAVGRRATATWTVRTSCTGNKCTSTVKSSTAAKPFTLDVSAASWNVNEKYNVGCFDTKTGTPTSQKVPVRYVRTLTPGSPSGNGSVSMVKGRDRYTQLKKCRNQSLPRQDVQARITLTKIR